MLGVKSIGVKTGGGLMKISMRRNGQLILGNNVDFANRWETGYPKKCYLRIGNGAKLIIGNNVGINSAQIFCDELIKIGDNALVGGGTMMFDTNFHNTNYLERRDPRLNGLSKTSPIEICEDVFIGGNCIICKGVTIGARSIVAAGSVVIKNIPPDELWGGNPAQFIKKINMKIE